MKKFAAMIAAMLSALLSVAVLAPAAQATNTAYPPAPTPTITITLNLSSVVSGHTFVATVNVTNNVHCTNLVVTFSGQTASAAGNTVTHTFTAPTVISATLVAVSAACTYGSATTGTAGHAITPHAQVATAAKDITVLPLSSAVIGKLPNTGGPSLGWLLGGIAALLAGAAAMYVGRRRENPASL